MSCTKTQDNLSLLVITTSGGGGHLQAANAKIAEERLKNASLHVVTHDVLATACGRWFGRFMINQIWNSAQRKGSVRALEFWAGGAPIFDVLFWIPVFIQIFLKLRNNHVTHVVDTQPLCLSPITYAVRAYNQLHKKHLVIEKILTELPTRYTSHYFAPIKRLRKKNRSLIQLITTKPLVADNQTAEHFWERYCGLPLSNIFYADFPIRPCFKKYQDLEKMKSPLVLKIILKNPYEKKLVQDLVQTGLSHAVFEESTLTLTLEPEDKVTTLMLGSQTVQEASLHYVKNFIDIIKNDLNTSIRYYFFVFCSHRSLEDIPLQDRIHSLIMSYPAYPSNLTIIPMSSQTDDVIAPLYFRSDATVTKAGGITAMELMAVAQGKIWIHREEKTAPLEKVLPLFSSLPYKGMPKWEYGNATYLGEMKGAEMISPEKFSEASKAYLCRPVLQKSLGSR
jgi:hypothetical protein